MKSALLITALLLGVATATAQDINLDIGSYYGVPAAGYGAAGQPGIWNLVPASATIVDVDGNPTDVAVILSYEPGFVPVGPATGDDEALLEDGMWVADVTANIVVEGLIPGAYEVIVYGIVTNDPGAQTWFWVQDEFVTVGGPWEGVFTEGVTHATLVLDVTEEPLVFTMVGAPWGSSGLASGIQFDLDGPIGTESSSWSGVKRLYDE